MGTVVERAIPQWVIDGIKSGKYKEWGGVVRHAAGSAKGGQIIAHLQFAGIEAAEKTQEALSGLASLTQASILLNGINLGVNIAGFAIVCKKLNKISDQLVNMEKKIDKLLMNIGDIQWDQEWMRQSKMKACFEDVSRGLKAGKETTVEVALNGLSQLRVYYMGVADKILDKIKVCYHEDATALQKISEMAVAISLVQSQALAHLGFPGEAQLLMEDCKAWYNNCKEKLNKPILEKAIWLGRLKDSQHESGAKECISWFKTVEQGLEYSSSQFEICEKSGKSYKEILELTNEKEPVAWVIVDEQEAA